MRSLHDKSFFWAWDRLYSESNPGREKDRWVVDGVLWLKERHAYWGVSYSIQLEVHQLETQLHQKGKWKILVVVERWWAEDKRECVRDQFWCKLVQGRAELVRAWLNKNSTEIDGLKSSIRSDVGSR